MSVAYTEPPDHNYGPSWGLEGSDLALWRCYAETGEDISEGPHGAWRLRAVEAVENMRRERDRFADALDAIQTRLRNVEDIL